VASIGTVFNRFIPKFWGYGVMTRNAVNHRSDAFQPESAKVAAFHTGVFDMIGFITACLLFASIVVAHARCCSVRFGRRPLKGRKNSLRRFCLVRRRQNRRNRPRLCRKPLKKLDDDSYGKAGRAARVLILLDRALIALSDEGMVETSEISIASQKRAWQFAFDLLRLGGPLIDRMKLTRNEAELAHAVLIAGSLSHRDQDLRTFIPLHRQVCSPLRRTPAETPEGPPHGVSRAYPSCVFSR
jgi:hypothetical protein